MDSVVLLHLLHRLAPRHDWQLSALHVHHGISPNADAWAVFCTALCEKLKISLIINRIDISPLRAHGLEAAARQLRHAAFAAQSADFVALAHHADDQAETLLLQLLRGAGVKGASAMPVLSLSKRPLLSAQTPKIVRPLLHSSRQEILDYAAAHQLVWIEDESNLDESYPRNFLRHALMPRLAERFPAYRQTLARSTQHFAEASALLEDLARLDAGERANEFAPPFATLEVARLQGLSPSRAKNLLRYFLDQQGAPMPQEVQLADMLRQLGTASEDAVVCVVFGGGAWQVRRYRGRVYALRALVQFERDWVLSWQGEEAIEWPALQSQLTFKSAVGEGISVAKLQKNPVTLRLRQGGETLRPHAKAATRTLKNLLQEQGIPPWQRDRLPLLYCGEELVCVPGVAVAADYQAVSGEAGVTFLCNNRTDCDRCFSPDTSLHPHA